MKDLTKLIDDLSSFSVQQQLDALCDGEFLGQYDVTQEQVEDLYTSLLA
jgi:hypothetical protein